MNKKHQVLNVSRTGEFSKRGLCTSTPSLTPFLIGKIIYADSGEAAEKVMALSKGPIWNNSWYQTIIEDMIMIDPSNNVCF